jgi:cyclic pyranopterin monophosphate synthase
MEFTHLDKQGNIQQVPVGHKPIVERKALAKGFIHLSSDTLRKIQNNQVSKGNVLAVARIAGIQAAKKTADLIPLCHMLLLDHAEVNFEIQSTGIGVVAQVVTSAKTGVEMEALTAVQVALLTIYDMCKAIDKTMRFENIHLVKKTKGQSK